MTAPVATEFRWWIADPDYPDWSRWHRLSGECLACCCGPVGKCSECGGQEHAEPGEPIEVYGLVHERMCQTCRTDAVDEPVRTEDR